MIVIAFGLVTLSWRCNTEGRIEQVHLSLVAGENHFSGRVGTNLRKEPYLVSERNAHA